ncbi:MAG TPA: hypothetical protein DCG69_05950 [Bacteroidales bacterium]|nr:hypothetical protein [Bacteroidales bacterium]
MLPIFYRICLAIFFTLVGLDAFAQDCDSKPNNRAEAMNKQAQLYLAKGQIGQAQNLLVELIQAYPRFSKGYLTYGEFHLQDYRSETSKAVVCFKKALDICADSSHKANFYLGKIYFGLHNFDQAIFYFDQFISKPVYCSKEDFTEATVFLNFSRVSIDLLAHPVPFNPVKVNGISSKNDEYLPFISADDEFALYTRRRYTLVDKGFDSEYQEIETFNYSLRQANGDFDQGFPMPYPFNRNPNEGAPSLTIDNNHLYYTLCVVDPKTKYLNCDIMHSFFNGKIWSDPKSLGQNINSPNTWESQPSIDASGELLYFSSNREGGFGGYDLYKTYKLTDGSWSNPINLGPTINTSGHEKSPFIHSDSQTLYFSSDGIPGLGGFDIFYTRLDSSNQFEKPLNIGYPINSFEDDLGFFVSTDGQNGYYASNRFDENRSWNLYSFQLYEKAKPQKVLFIKGNISQEDAHLPSRAKVEIKNLNTRTTKEIPVDSISGRYVAVLLFRDDLLLTVKKKGFVLESKFIGTTDSIFKKPAVVNVQIQPIEVGQSYEIHDIYFESNSDDLTPNSLEVIQEFFIFLQNNPGLHIEIQGHTDFIGNEQANLILSENRAKAVYESLVQLGIDQNRLLYKGFGESVPVADNNTSFGRSKNRRTVFIVMEK